MGANTKIDLSESTIEAALSYGIDVFRLGAVESGEELSCLVNDTDF
jgi:hypothetical protein